MQHYTQKLAVDPVTGSAARNVTVTVHRLGDLVEGIALQALAGETLDTLTTDQNGVVPDFLLPDDVLRVAWNAGPFWGIWKTDDPIFPSALGATADDRLTVTYADGTTLIGPQMPRGVDGTMSPAQVAAEITTPSSPVAQALAGKGYAQQQELRAATVPGARPASVPGTRWGMDDAVKIARAGVAPSQTRQLSFPNMGREADGTIVLLVNDAIDGAGSAADHKPVLMMQSQDSGRTWTTAVVTYSDPGSGRWAGLCGFTILPDGRWCISLQTADTSQTLGSYQVAVAFSSNRGASWTTVSLGKAGAGYVPANSAPVTVLANGDYLLPIYACDTNGGTWYARFMVSTDQGATWAKRSDIKVSGVNVEEPMVAQASDGTIYTLLRSTTDSQTRRAVSTDNGATWSTPTVVMSNTDARPQIVKLSGGGWLVYNRDAAPSRSSFIAYSKDNLQTFVDRKVVIGPDFRTTYGDLIEVAPGRVLAVWGSEHRDAGGSTYGDLWMRYITDGGGLTPTGGNTAWPSWFRATAGKRLLAWDTFNRPDQPAAGPADSGHRYQGADPGGFEIINNHLHAVGGNTGAVIDVGTPNVEVEADLTGDSATLWGQAVAFRYTDINNHLRAAVETNGTKLRVYQVQGGTATMIAGAEYTITWPRRPGQLATMRVVVRGDVIRVWYDGELAITTTSTYLNTRNWHGVVLNVNSFCRNLTIREA